jgi:hypothetical protein
LSRLFRKWSGNLTNLSSILNYDDPFLEIEYFAESPGCNIQNSNRCELAREESISRAIDTALVVKNFYA